MQWSKIMRTFK